MNLIDTPGFEAGSEFAEAEILREIPAILFPTSHSRKLGGILYLCPINAPRISTFTRYVAMIQKIVGIQNMDLLLLVTTMWDTVQYKERNPREDQLLSPGSLHGGTMGRNAKVARTMEQRIQPCI